MNKTTTMTSLYELLGDDPKDVQKVLGSHVSGHAPQTSNDNRDIIKTVDSGKLPSIFDLETRILEIGSLQTYLFRLHLCPGHNRYGLGYDLPSNVNPSNLIKGWNSIIRTSNAVDTAPGNGHNSSLITDRNNTTAQIKGPGSPVDAARRSPPNSTQYHTPTNSNHHVAWVPTSGRTTTARTPTNIGRVPSTPTKWQTPRSESPGNNSSPGSVFSQRSRATTETSGTSRSASSDSEVDDAPDMMFIVLGYIERLDLRGIDGPPPEPEDFDYDYVEDVDGESVLPTQKEVDSILNNPRAYSNGKDSTISPEALKKLRKLDRNSEDSSWIHAAGWTETEVWVVLKLDGKGRPCGIYLVSDEEALGEGGAGLFHPDKGGKKFLWARLGRDLHSCTAKGFDKELKLVNVAKGTARHGLVVKVGTNEGVRYEPVDSTTRV